MTPRTYNLKPETCLGLDLTAGARATGYAVLDADGALADVGLVGDEGAILALAASCGAKTVAIDAPLGLPAGLCCLEESCECRAVRTPGIRLSELAVRRRGYQLYHTTKRSIIKSMVYRGIGLRRAFEDRGLCVIEVYPYATKVALFGRKMPRKTTPAGLAWLRERVESVVAGVAPIERALSHDELDAVLAAHTAVLLACGRAEALGDAAEGAIVVPVATALTPAGRGGG